MKRDCFVQKLKNILCCLLLLPALSVCGCGSGKNTRIILTTGFAQDELFRIETVSCTRPELMVYLITTRNQYEDIYSSEIWKATVGDMTLEENVKEMVLAKAARIKTLNLMAAEKGILLNQAEKNLAAAAAKEYFESLSEEEIEALGVTQELIEKMYGEYALAQKVYEDIIVDINPEISDDEARTIVVEHILIKTYMTNGLGERLDYSDMDCRRACERAEMIYGLATDGEHDFESLIASYSEDPVGKYAFRRGEMTSAFEEAAFNLGAGEISEVIEDEYGYHIIKCISTFDREETDRNKRKIVEEKKEEKFGEEYDAFVSTLTRMLNEEAWEEIRFVYDENVRTSNYFEVYERYFTKN